MSRVFTGQRGQGRQVLLSTIGSLGDVQPWVALAVELRALGRKVRLCVPPDFYECAALAAPRAAADAGSARRRHRHDEVWRWNATSFTALFGAAAPR